MLNMLLFSQSADSLSAHRLHPPSAVRWAPLIELRLFSRMRHPRSTRHHAQMQRSRAAVPVVTVFWRMG
jgi:hypothetical protein